MNNHDELYRQLARRYADQWGDALREEARTLAGTPTPRLDRKVRAALGRRRARRWMALATLAACVALALYASPLRQTGSGGVPAESNTAIEDTVGIEGPDADTSAPGALPLSFALPGQFAIEDVTVDRGQTVYTLADTLRDPVVLTLEEDAAPLDTGGLTPIDLAGGTVYAKATADYSLITFDRGSIRYVMTCRYDVNTLLALSRAILI